jgi:carbonic anhydrase
MQSIRLWIFMLLGGASLLFSDSSTSLSQSEGVSAQESLKKLKEGNQRFLEERAIRPNQTFERVVRISKGQKPFVSVLSCSDSRVPPEMLLDQGFGDLFVVRVAGNVADTDEMGSLEYGLAHLGTKLLVVLGHTGCGAVTAVVKGDSLHGHIPALVDNIIPATKKAQQEGVSADELVARSIELNVFQSMEDILKKSSEIRQLVKNQKVMIVGAVYDINNGRVKWMGEHPDLGRLLQDHEANPSPESSRVLNILKPSEDQTSGVDVVIPEKLTTPSHQDH